MKEYIDKESILQQINIEITNLNIAQKEGFITEYGKGMLESLDGLLDFINNLETKEINDVKIPKHSYFEEIYHVGSEPIWKIGDTLAAYEFYSDYEGTHIYGEIVDIKMDEEYGDWVYFFKKGEDSDNKIFESELIREEAYRYKK